MQTPQVFLSAAPDGADVQCAVAYLASRTDAYGWFVGRRHDGTYARAYFLIENLFANAPATYEAVADPHADWGLDEPRRHALAQMQELFAHEWLAFGDGVVSVRDAQRGRLVEGTFYSPGFQAVVLRQLAKHWTLEYRPNMQRIAAEQERRKATHARP